MQSLQINKNSYNCLWIKIGKKSYDEIVIERSRSKGREVYPRRAHCPTATHTKARPDPCFSLALLASTRRNRVRFLTDCLVVRKEGMGKRSTGLSVPFSFSLFLVCGESLTVCHICDGDSLLNILGFSRAWFVKVSRTCSCPCDAWKEWKDWN